MIVTAQKHVSGIFSLGCKERISTREGHFSSSTHFGARSLWPRIAGAERLDHDGNRPGHADCIGDLRLGFASDALFLRRGICLLEERRTTRGRAS
jgi:hypothetical protein